MSKQPDYLDGEEWRRRAPEQPAATSSPAPARPSLVGRLRVRVAALGALGTVLLLVLCGTAAAGSFLALAEWAIRFIPVATPPANCTAGRDCVYVSSADDNLYQLHANGTTTNLSVPGVGTSGVVNVMSYGATGNGTTDDTTAIQAAVTAAPVGAAVYLPPGNYYLTSTITVSTQYVRIVGSGVYGTRITFNPSGAAAVFTFSAGASEITGCSIQGIYFKAFTGNTQQKIAISIVDGDGFIAKDIYVDPTGAANAIGWSGNNSIGIQIKGRQSTVIDRVRLWADTPIQIDSDPNVVSPVNTDHLHISNTYLLSKSGGGNAIIKVSDHVMLTNVIIDGDNAWILDKYGLYWNDSGGVGSNSNMIVIRGVRMEQAVDFTGYSIWIDTQVALQSLQIEALNASFGSNGIHLRGVKRTSIRNSIFSTNDATKVHLDLGATVNDIWLENDEWQVNTLANMTGMTKIWALPTVASGSALPTTGWFSDSTTAGTQPATLSSLVTYVANIFKNTSAANTTPTTFDTASTFTGGNPMFVWNNNTVQKAFIDSGGSFVSASGNFDNLGATQLHLGGSTASSVALGKGGASVFVSGSTLACASAGGCTVGGGGNYPSNIFVQHLTGAGAAPSATVGGATQLGTSPTCTLTGSDSFATITITTGTTPAAFVANTAATMCTVGLTAFSATPKSMIVDEANSAAAAIKTGASGVNFYVDSAASSSSTAVIKAVSAGTPTLAASTAYIVYLSTGG